MPSRSQRHLVSVGRPTSDGVPPANALPPSPPVNFYGSGVPAGSAANDPAPLTLGANFEPLAPGIVKSVRWYRGNAAAAATGKAAIWRRNGTLLKAVSFTGHTGVGWKTVALDYTIDQLDTYTVGVWMTAGSGGNCWYWAQANKFQTTRLAANDGTRDVAIMPASDGLGSRNYAGANNVFADPSPTDITFPNAEFNGSGYAIDIEFVPVIPAEPALPTTPPTGWDDPRFAANTAAPIVSSPHPYRDGMVIQNRDFVSSGGNSLVSNIANCKYINCRFKGSEGPRIGGAGTYQYIGCYIECAARAADDHADGIQAFCPAAAPTVNIIGTHVKLTTEFGFGNNAAVFFSDNARATISIKDCRFDGFTEEGLLITNANATTDISAVNLSVENTVLLGGVPFILVGPAQNWAGVITKWTNVTNGANGAQIPNPYP